MGFSIIYELTMTKRFLVLVCAAFMAVAMMAQKRTTMLVLYKDFRPSTITFADGHRSRQSFTNVFLKNATLLFLKGELTMEANMDNIVRVDFDDRHFVNIDNQLACIVDSVGDNVLYRVELFDKESYERNLSNNVNISNLDLGEQVSTTTIKLNNEDDYKLPVIPVYYMLYNGKILKVHERTLWNHLPKDKRRIFKTIVGMDNFNWTNDAQLMKLLKAISE